MTELYWILFAAILLAGTIRGVYAAVRQLYGYSNPYLFGESGNVLDLGLLPVAALQAGVLMAAGLAFPPPSYSFFVDENYVPFVLLIMGSSGVLCLGQAYIRSLPDTLKRRAMIVFGNVSVSLIVWTLYGQFLRESSLSLSGALLGGGLLGLIEGQLLKKRTLKGFHDQESVNVFPLWIITAFTGTMGHLGIYLALWGSLPLFLLALIFNNSVPLLVSVVERGLSKVLSLLLRRCCFRRIVCENCLQYTSPLRSRYEIGVRFCEHCRQIVESTDVTGKVVVSFGEMPLNLTGRVFLLDGSAGEFWESQPVDVSEIYIDTSTCRPHQVERFVSYLLQIPPKNGVRSIKIFYHSELERLGANLANLLQNTFVHIARLSADAPSLTPLADFEKRDTPIWKHSIAPLSSPPQKAHSPKSGWKERLAGWSAGSLWGMLTVALAAMLFWGLPDREVSDPVGMRIVITFWMLVSIFIVGKKMVRSKSSFFWIVLTFIFVVIAAIAIPGLQSATQRSKQKRTLADLRALGSALSDYQESYGHFPASYGLVIPLTEKVGKDYIVPRNYYSGSRRDGWGNPYQYMSYGDSYTIVSYGKDGEAGSREYFGEDICMMNGELRTGC